MAEPKILEMEKMLNNMLTNMKISTNSLQEYSHTGDYKILQEPLRFQSSNGNSKRKIDI